MRSRPGKRFRANAQANAEPATSAMSVAALATAKDNLIGNQSITVDKPQKH
jgi:hypothetical protein